MDKQAVEAQLCQLPVSQYAWIDPREIEFSERVRYVCEHECAMYGTSWACPCSGMWTARLRETGFSPWGFPRGNWRFL